MIRVTIKTLSGHSPRSDERICRGVRREHIICSVSPCGLTMSICTRHGLKLMADQYKNENN